MKKRFLVGAALAFALVGCGGDGTSAPPTMGGGGTPTPSPSPSPTPTPSPSPTPAPTPTYQTYSQLTGTQTFATVCGGTTSPGPGQGPFPVGGAAFNNSQFGRGITIVSDRAEPNYTVSSDGTGLFGTFSTTFNQSNRDSSRPGEAYIKASPNNFTERLSVFPITQNGAELEFLRVSSVVAEVGGGSTIQNCAFGVPTLLTDIPASAVTYNGLAFFGTATVTQNLGGGPTASYRITSSITSLAANPANGQITFTLNLRGQEVTQAGVATEITELGTFSGSTTIDGTQQGYTDSLVNASNTGVGGFGGWFFGPQGGTAAVSFNLQDRRADNSDLRLGGMIILRPQ